MTTVQQASAVGRRVDDKPSDVDGLPYSTLLYGNGPGYSTEHRLVPMVNATDAEKQNRLHGAAVPRQWATHGGEDVPVYAAGPPGITQALFSGTFDQSYVPHAIAYVACLAEHAKRCQLQDEMAVARNGSTAFAAGKTGVIGVGPSSQVRFLRPLGPARRLPGARFRFAAACVVNS
ncbi:Alkaline-phosphatase-like, core domain,Alkaline phosphatase-like, alpha/beta/alpha,Alkaline phosphatase [Cinara cedri]|uniref:alkaline phosphatase n=1 Tax=Cinara cedri TaxID=506608 RepID=A0A5E4M1Y2_9HEMI|nr:Alkaline-phosphatase-like, core domain,Alkaline phosphatase-like, alpha/beta/alpha,Alkaline phosphatase [Cinara cedri]